MKFKVLFLLFFFTFLLSKAQEKKVFVNWSSTVLNDFKLTVSTEDPSIEFSESGNLQGVLSWEVSQGSKYNTIEQVVYKKVDTDFLGSYINLDLPKDFTYSFTEQRGGDILFQSVSFSPIVKDDNNVLHIVTSFTLKNISLAASTSNLFNSYKSLNQYSTKASLSSSVLSSGEWFRFQTDTTGVYKITPSFLASLGMDLSSVDPTTIKIYGDGGQALSLINKEDALLDLPENPIKVIGGTDGSFSGSDYLLFYARGTQKFNSENNSHLNPYSDSCYYYITHGGNSSGLRITAMQEPDTVSDTSVFTTYDHYDFYEKDLYNLGSLGRVWFGDIFDIQTSRFYEFDLPELSSSEDTFLEVGLSFAGVFAISPILSVKGFQENNIFLDRDFTFVSYNAYNNAYRLVETTMSIDPSNITNNIPFQVGLDYNKGADVTSLGYLDYLTIKARCILKGQGKQFGFSNEDVPLGGGSEFLISNASGIESVWDVTNPYQITEKVNSGLEDTLSIYFTPTADSYFVALDPSDFYTPVKTIPSQVFNQDIKGSVSSRVAPIEYLVITKPEYIASANRLAEFRNTHDGFETAVYTTTSIYNEFSTGRQDLAALRNFVKYVYDQGTEGNRLRYLCIIGDGSYDYKDRIDQNTNDVPLYHSLESSSFTGGFCSDDFFTFMDIGEGNNLSVDKMDFAVGRIVADSSSKVAAMVSKIINYYSEDTYGDWRNSILFVSDDVDSESDAQIQSKILEVSSKLEADIPRAQVKKIFSDAYSQEATAGGFRYPDAKKQLIEDMYTGVTYINYFGHGGEIGVSSEQLFLSSDARSLLNTYRMPVFVTLTCELTRFDNPARQTAGEFLFWNEQGGAIGMLTTTRNLFLSVGLQLNSQLALNLYDEDGNFYSIGEAIMKAKQNLFNINKRTVLCIGDPALAPVFPSSDIVLTHVNSQDLTSWENSNLALQGLTTVQLQGEIHDQYTGQKDTSFNGEVSVGVFDKALQNQTLGNDGVQDNTGELITIDFNTEGNSVYKGKASVVNGDFTLDFMMPKNISLQEGTGALRFYAYDYDRLEDVSGKQDILLGGVSSEAVVDEVSPEIKVFLEDFNFVSGASVGGSPLLIVDFYDSSGINTAGGVGKDIVAILDEDTLNPIVLNSFYSSKLDTFQEGELRYQLNDLSVGMHTLQVRASDIHGNTSIQRIDFNVSEQQDFKITEVLNYPNPFTTQTGFWFTHNSSITDVLEVRIQILTVSGKIITTKNVNLVGKSTYNGDIGWNAKDDFGNSLAKGVYLYKIQVHSTDLNTTVSKIEKLVIL